MSRPVLRTALAVAAVMALPPGLSAQGFTPERSPAWEALVHGSALIISLDASDKPVGLGTGWLVDAEKKLLITNYHVVGAGTKARVLFATFKKDGRITIDRIHYDERLLAGQSFGARVLLRHKRTDLAVLQLDGVSEQAKALKMATVGPRVKDVAHSLGQSGRGRYGSCFDCTSRVVAKVSREKWSHGVLGDEPGQWTTQELEAVCVQAASRSWPGDSGGPLVNEQGELVGVLCSGSRTHTLFIEVSEVREILTSTGFLRPESAAKSADSKDLRLPVRLRMLLPPKGQLEVNGAPVPYLGETHNYTSSPQTVGEPAEFRVRVSWEDGGRVRRRSETVTAEPGGRTVEIDLRPDPLAEDLSPEELAAALASPPPPALPVGNSRKFPAGLFVLGMFLVAGPLLYYGFFRKKPEPVEEEPPPPAEDLFDRVEKNARSTLPIDPTG